MGVGDETPVLRNAKILSSFPFSIHRLIELEAQTRDQLMGRQESQELLVGPSLLETKPERVRTAVPHAAIRSRHRIFHNSKPCEQSDLPQ